MVYQLKWFSDPHSLPLLATVTAEIVEALATSVSMFWQVCNQ